MIQVGLVRSTFRHDGSIVSCTKASEPELYYIIRASIRGILWDDIKCEGTNFIARYDPSKVDEVLMLTRYSGHKYPKRSEVQNLFREEIMWQYYIFHDLQETREHFLRYKNCDIQILRWSYQGNIVLLENLLLPDLVRLKERGLWSEHQYVAAGIYLSAIDPKFLPSVKALRSL